jgi:AraC family transcriptional regulator
VQNSARFLERVATARASPILFWLSETSNIYNAPVAGRMRSHIDPAARVDTSDDGGGCRSPAGEYLTQCVGDNALISSASNNHIRGDRMGVLQVIDESDGIRHRSHMIPGSMSDRSSLSEVNCLLDTALRLWDEDRVKAKSQVNVAAALLRGLVDDLPFTRQLGSAPDGCLAPSQARKVKEFVDASLDSTIRLGDCASKVGLSNSHFSRAFKAAFGTTLSHYIRCRRAGRAKQLMLASNEPLSQIALACGFADQAHYCRVFRNVFGISPNTWRRHNVP